MGKQLTRDEAVGRLRSDLAQVLGARLLSLVTYEAPGTDGHLVHALAVVEEFSADDLLRLAPAATGWKRAGLAVPLIFDRDELERVVDAFPLEFSQILAHHQVVAGETFLAGLSVRREDLRRACEAQARSHLVHLREGYLQAGAGLKAVAALVDASLVPLRALLVNVARLHGVDPPTPEALAAFLTDRFPAAAAGLVPLLRLSPEATLAPSDAERLFPGYLEGVGHLAHALDAL